MQVAGLLEALEPPGNGNSVVCSRQDFIAYK